MNARVYELPLFPLNVVLFPGQPLPLHIFEPRYRVMIRRCIESSSPFGVLLHSFDLGDTESAVGTTAHISEVEALSDGRMNILTFGKERFLLHRYYASPHGYLIGEVSDYPFAELPAIPPERVQAMQRRLHRFVEVLNRETDTEITLSELPDKPLLLATLAAIALPTSLETKQKLLAQPSVRAFFDAVYALLDREVRLSELAEMAIQPPQDTAIPFCRN